MRHYRGLTLVLPTLIHRKPTSFAINVYDVGNGGRVEIGLVSPKGAVATRWDDRPRPSPG